MNGATLPLLLTMSILLIIGFLYLLFRPEKKVDAVGNPKTVEL